MDEIQIQEIINKYNTPIYIFDIKKLRQRIKYLKKELPKDIEMCYAIKANTFIIEDIADLVDRFEVCSPGEYQICKKKNIEQEKILISGVYKEANTIQEMIKNDKKVNYYTIESMEQFNLFKNIKGNRKINILIRLTSGNQFGINESEIEEIIKNRENYDNIEIKGIQYFSGTQKISLKNIKRELEHIDDLIQKLEEKYNYTTEELEFGGGFPVLYFKNTEFNEEEYLKEFSQIISNIKFKGKKILELGRSIVANSRILYYKSCRYKE